MAGSDAMEEVLDPSTTSPTSQALPPPATISSM